MTTTDMQAKFHNVSCSQCGRDFGPGNSGFSDCRRHAFRDWLYREGCLLDEPTKDQCIDAQRRAFEAALASRPDAQDDERGAFQSRVHPWMLACFGSAVAADTVERNHRFFEEAAELVQACGMTASEAHQLVDYTWSRPIGEKTQEVGGVMVTLAALCLANGLDMHAAGETELARISAPEIMAKIRAKQAAKPKHSPLPEARAAAPQAEAAQGVPDGWKIVPTKVDNAMIDAANNVPSGIAGSPPHWQWVWDAILAAAPSPDREQVGEAPEGCTPADAEMLRAANHSLAAENDRLRRRLRPFAQLASSPLSWAMVEYCIADDPEKQTLQAPQMQRAFNRAADALREDASPSRECGSLCAKAASAPTLSAAEREAFSNWWQAKLNAGESPFDIALGMHAERCAEVAQPGLTDEQRITDLQAEIDRLNAIINTPQSGDFLRAVSIEAEHQRQRWGSLHDAGKTPADWFWLVGYLGGKALHAHAAGNIQKAEHHVITAAAACENWHLDMFGKTDMRPGIDGEAALGAQEE